MSGSRTFFVNEHGEITMAVNKAHNGENTTAITAGAALVTTELTLMTGDPAIGTVGGDGSMWRVMHQ